jgi:signal transduction histidine kinase
MNQVDALLPTDISKRLQPMNQYDELSRLVITFNKLLDRLQKVFRVQKMFMSNISHELKNPLNVITSQVEVILQKDRSNEEYKETLVSVLHDVKELNEIGEKLMQMAQINADDAIIRFDPIRIDEAIWAAKDGLKKTHPEYKINFEIVNLPELEEKVYIHGNEKLLKTALVNLMDNGCKFSPDKDVSVQLSFLPKETPVIQISDKGPGIPEEEINLVFNAFYRSAATSMVKGSGIGLSLVDSILKLHHVDLKVSSKAGEGTTFTLTFPSADMLAIMHSEN